MVKNGNTDQKWVHMDIWITGTQHQLFIGCSYIILNFQKNKVVSGKTPFIVIRPVCTPNSICRNIGF